MLYGYRRVIDRRYSRCTADRGVRKLIRACDRILLAVPRSLLGIRHRAVIGVIRQVGQGGRNGDVDNLVRRGLGSAVDLDASDHIGLGTGGYAGELGLLG